MKNLVVPNFDGLILFYKQALGSKTNKELYGEVYGYIFRPTQGLTEGLESCTLIRLQWYHRHMTTATAQAALNRVHFMPETRLQLPQ